MNRKPLTIADGAIQQLQTGEELDIPLEVRFRALQENFRVLLMLLVEQDVIELPCELAEELKDWNYAN